jgi:hypothetical protein
LGFSSIKGDFWLQVNQENESDANGWKFWMMQLTFWMREIIKHTIHVMIIRSRNEFALLLFSPSFVVICVAPSVA